MRNKRERTNYCIKCRGWNGEEWIVEVDEHINPLNDLTQSLKAFEFFVEQEKATFMNPDTRFCGNQSLILFERLDNGKSMRRIKRWHF